MAKITWNHVPTSRGLPTSATTNDHKTTHIRPSGAASSHFYFPSPIRDTWAAPLTARNLPGPRLSSNTIVQNHNFVPQSKPPRKHACKMPSGQGAGTNPIHNKKPKKKAQELDEDDLAHKAKLAADKKAQAELAKTVGKGKGPLNTGSQGIKKSGKK